MPSPYSSILFKAEEAVALLLDTLTGIPDIYLAGNSPTDNGGAIAGDWINVECRAATPRPPVHVGNWTCDVFIEVHTSTDDQARTARKAIAGKIGDLLCQSDLAARLTAALADFTCHGIISSTPLAARSEGRRHVLSMGIQFAACPSSV